MASTSTSVSSGRVATDSYDDFYITCNPPLSSDGITFVLENVKSHFGNDSLLGTIVYEADVPWIRYSTRISDQPVVAEYIQSLLARILDEDLHASEDSDDDDDDEEPNRLCRVVPINSSGTVQPIQEPNEALRYPEGTSLPHMNIWRGIEDLDGLTIEDFLERCADRLCLDPNHAFDRWDEVGFRGNCRDTHAVLAGSNLETITKTTSRLDRLLSFFQLINNEPLANHLIYFEGRKNCQFHFRSMAKLGLHKTTLALPLREGSNLEAQQMSNSAVLRTMQCHGQGKWAIDPTRYDTVDVSKLPTKALTVFGQTGGFSPKSRQQEPFDGSFSIGAASPESEPTNASSNNQMPAVDGIQGLSLNASCSDKKHATRDNSVPTLQKLVDIDLLGDIEEAFKPTSTTHILDEQNPHGLPAAMEPVKAQPEAENNLIVFDCHDESPKKLHRTMNQKAGRSSMAEGPTVDSQIAHLQKLIETHLKKGVDVLRYAPGRVELKMEFGRLYHAGLQASLVSDKGAGSESWPLPEALSMLKKHAGTAMFSPVLSTREADAKTLAGLSLAGGKWTFVGVETFFDIFCVRNELHESIVVELNARDLSHTYRNENPSHLSKLFVHYPQQAWDLAAIAKTFGVSDSQMQPTVAAIMDDLEIAVNEGTGEVTVLSQSTCDSIRDIHIRRVASYCLDDSVLEISLTSLTSINETVETGLKVFKGSVIPLPGPVPCDAGNPQQWIRACVSSKHAGKLFAQNLAMEIGDDATYDGNLFQQEGILSSIYKPALGMVTRMDNVGITNNNSSPSVCHKENSRSQGPRSTERSVTSGRPYEWW